MLFASLLGFLRLDFRWRPKRWHRSKGEELRLGRVERLEDRCLLDSSGNYLLVADWGGDKVPRYEGDTGAFVDEFVPKRSGGMNHPFGILFGPIDGNLYVSTGSSGGPGQVKAVLRYDGGSGAFIDEFTKGGDLLEPLAIIFGPDGNLYVATGTGGFGGRVARYDGRTGTFLGDFVPLASGGLRGPSGMVFGPSGRGGALDLYVSSSHTDSVLRYDGTTGEFLGEFVAGGSGGLDEPKGLTFGPDGNLYVASSSNLSVLRFQGPSGRTPGAFIDVFVPRGAGGLETPWGVVFGPDGNGDGNFELYVSNSELSGGSAQGKNATVKRYDGVTGAFIDTFVTARSGGLDDAQLLTFTQTDPVTLAFTGGKHLTPSSTATAPLAEPLSSAQGQPLLPAAVARSQAAGADTSGFSTTVVSIADSLGDTLGMASDHTIWLGANAAGRGWYIDAMPTNDSAYLTPGGQGKQGRMELLTAMSHELGHVLGSEHSDHGTLHDTLVTRERHVPTSSNGVLEPELIDSILFNKKQAWVNELLANDPLHDLATLLD